MRSALFPREYRKMSVSSTPTDEEREGLRWELSLDRSDLRSHGWYHGNISRTATDQLLNGDGDFLVRESASRPGDFVLSCRIRGSNLHFVVSKVIVQSARFNKVFGEKLNFIGSN